MTIPSHKEIVSNLIQSHLFKIIIGISLIEGHYLKEVVKSRGYSVTGKVTVKTLVNPMDDTVKSVYENLMIRNPNQPEFHQAVY